MFNIQVAGLPLYVCFFSFFKFLLWPFLFSWVSRPQLRLLCVLTERALYNGEGVSSWHWRFWLSNLRLGCWLLTHERTFCSCAYWTDWTIYLSLSRCTNTITNDQYCVINRNLFLDINIFAAYSCNNTQPLKVRNIFKTWFSHLEKLCRPLTRPTPFYLVLSRVVGDTSLL